MLHAYFNTARNGKLIGMNLGTHAIFCTSLNYLGCLLNGKETFVAEYIDEIGKFLFCNSRNHTVAYMLHIFALSASVCTSYGVCAKECSTHFQRSILLYASYHTQNLQFIFECKSVARFYLYKPGTHGDNFVYALHCLTVQLIFACVVQSVGRIQNTASAFCNLFV